MRHRHEFVIAEVTSMGTRRVACDCGQRPRCLRLKTMLLDDGTPLTYSRGHAQGESRNEATLKAGLVNGLDHRSRSDPDWCEPVVCKHCGFWTLS